MSGSIITGSGMTGVFVFSTISIDSHPLFNTTCILTTVFGEMEISVRIDIMNATNQRASLKEALADCQQQIDHPLYSSILGLEVPAVEATETNLAAHAIANRNAADHPA